MSEKLRWTDGKVRNHLIVGAQHTICASPTSPMDLRHSYATGTDVVACLSANPTVLTAEQWASVLSALSPEMQEAVRVAWLGPSRVGPCPQRTTCERLTPRAEKAESDSAAIRVKLTGAEKRWRAVAYEVGAERDPSTETVLETARALKKHAETSGARIKKLEAQVETARRELANRQAESSARIGSLERELVEMKRKLTEEQEQAAYDELRWRQQLESREHDHAAAVARAEEAEAVMESMKTIEFATVVGESFWHHMHESKTDGFAQGVLRGMGGGYGYFHAALKDALATLDHTSPAQPRISEPTDDEERGAAHMANLLAAVKRARDEANLHLSRDAVHSLALAIERLAVLVTGPRIRSIARQEAASVVSAAASRAEVEFGANGQVALVALATALEDGEKS